MRNNCSQVVLENFFEPCILYLLSRNSSYGYELKKRLNEECGCNVNIGNLYRCLNRLAQDGFISKDNQKSPLGPTKAVYTITKKGKELLSQWIKELKIQKQAMELLIFNYEKAFESH